MWSKFRRQTFPPSVQAFDAKIADLESLVVKRMHDMQHKLARVVELFHDADARQIELLEGIRQTNLTAQEIRIRQDHIHAADQQAVARRATLLEMSGAAPTQKDLLALLRLLEPKRVLNFPKKRLGSSFDGGYVIVDDLEGIDRAFSLGISDNDDWDVQIADCGIDVAQYDHTIECAPTAHERLHFFPLKVAATGEPNSITLQEMTNNYSDKSKCILKCDIEGSEWELIDHTPSKTINRFSQIVCEFHWFQKLAEPEFYETALRVWRKISETHQAIHLHANNHAPIINLSNICFPTVIEVTYVRKSSYNFVDTDEIFPTELDAPNNNLLPDIFLGSMRF